MLLLLALVGCNKGTEDSGSIAGSPPEASILWPEDGAVFAEGAALVLRGSVSDADDEASSLLAGWWVDGADACSEAAPEDSGDVACTLTLAAGNHDLTLYVNDPAGHHVAVSVSVSAQASDVPVVVITGPDEELRWYVGDNIPLEGTVSDAEDPVQQLAVAWESSLDGELAGAVGPGSDGATGVVAQLGEGSHVITLSATDSAGHIGADQRTLQVQAANRAPSCSVTAPAEEAVFAEGETVTFAATASDEDQPSEDLLASWSSSLDGDLGSVTPTPSGEAPLSSDALSDGTHLVTLLVTDERGETCSDSVSVQIGLPPTVEIVAPSAGEVVDEDDPVSFSAIVWDQEDTEDDLVLEWSSSLDGVFHSGSPSINGLESFEESGLTAGDHTVTVTVTDTNDQQGSATVDLTINGRPSAPLLHLEPDPADTQDTLVVVMDADSVDPEGGTVSYTWEWAVGGVASSASTSDSLDSSYTLRGETWELTVTPLDSLGATGPSTSSSLTIANAVPTVSSVTLSPSPPVTDDLLTATVSASDPDGDGVTLSYAWTVASTTLSETGPTLSGAFFVKGESVSVSVTPNDGTEDGSALSSSAVTVANTPPEAPTVAISPSDPIFDEDGLTCEISGDSYDADGDVISYTATWEVDGVDYPDGDTAMGWTGPSTTTWADDTVPVEDAAEGTEWTCTMTPNDGDDDGTTGSDTVEMSEGGCDAPNSSYSLDGAVELYGYCWYLGKQGLSCDTVCAGEGGTNLANSAATAWSDSCGSPASADVSTHFYNNGNACAWSYGAATGYHTLGYGYYGASYYGKCASGGSNNHGTFPGDPNNSSTRCLVCACSTN